jgi:5-carboxymethyl-2-hydroxymuconate isomerase
MTNNELLIAKKVLEAYLVDIESLDIINRTENQTRSFSEEKGHEVITDFFGPTPQQSMMNLSILIQDIDARLGLKTIKVSSPHGDGPMTA